MFQIKIKVAGLVIMICYVMHKGIVVYQGIMDIE